MKFFILLVFCFGVKANPPLKDSCGLRIKTAYDRLRSNEKYVKNKCNIIEPCSLDDFDCIRDFMAKNSNCKRVYGSVPDPLYIPQSTIYYANTNITFTYSNSTGSGLRDISVRSYFYNKKTNVLYFAINIPVLFFDIPKLCISYRRVGQESMRLCDKANATFRSLIFTARIKKVRGKYSLDLADAKLGYVGKIDPDFYIGPKAYRSKDPIVTAAFADFLTTVPLNARTAFSFVSELLTFIYIQTNICDFRAKLYSV